MTAVTRIAAGTLLLVASALPLAAQRPGRNADRLPPHVQAQLWPDRELSPAEQELKDRVIVMRDTLTRVHATVALLQRQQRSASGSGVIRSAARTLAADCAGSSRVAQPMATFAAGLATNDTKWGEPSVKAFRSALAELRTAMDRCTTSLAAMADAANPDREEITTAAMAAAEVVRKYQRAESDLLRTLKIRIDPLRDGGSGGR